MCLCQLSHFKIGCPNFDSLCPILQWCRTDSTWERGSRSYTVSRNIASCSSFVRRTRRTSCPFPFTTCQKSEPRSYQMVPSYQIVVCRGQLFFSEVLNKWAVPFPGADKAVVSLVYRSCHAYCLHSGSCMFQVYRSMRYRYETEGTNPVSESPPIPPFQRLCLLLFSVQVPNVCWFAVSVPSCRHGNLFPLHSGTNLCTRWTPPPTEGMTSSRHHGQLY